MKYTPKFYFYLVIWRNGSPHGQMWRCDLNAVTQSPSQPSHLPGIHPGCWSRWLAGGTGQTARYYTKSYLSRVTQRWVIENRIHTDCHHDKLMQTHTLVSSFCHKGTVEELNHGVLLFVFCITEIKTTLYLCNLANKGENRMRSTHRVTYFPFAASWKASSSQSSSLWENSLTSWNKTNTSRCFGVKAKISCVVVILKDKVNWLHSWSWKQQFHGHSSGVWPPVITLAVLWWHLSYSISHTDKDPERWTCPEMALFKPHQRSLHTSQRCMFVGLQMLHVLVQLSIFCPKAQIKASLPRRKISETENKERGEKRKC